MQDPTPAGIVIKPFAALVAKQFTKGELWHILLKYTHKYIIFHIAGLIQTSDLSPANFVRRLLDRHRFGKCTSGYTITTENISKNVMIL